MQLAESRQFNLLKNEMLKNPNVLRVAGSVHHVGQSFRHETVQMGAEKQEVFRFDIGANYPQVLGPGLHAGRFFEVSRQVEDENAVVVSEAFVKKHFNTLTVTNHIQHSEAN